MRGASSSGSRNVFRGKEIAGFINIGPYTQAGLLATIKINPLLMAAPRLKNMAENFQQYRFRRLRVSIRGDLPTTVSGALYTGYTRNPDYSITDTPDAPAFIFSLEKSTITNLWSITDFDCPLQKSQWYNVDQDSTEIMMTTQGQLFIGTAGGFNITNPYEVPLFFEYEVEFMGQQSKGFSDQQVIAFPATQYSGASDAAGKVRLLLAPGETLDYPWNRGMAARKPYFCIPQPVLTVKGTTTVTPEIIQWDGNTSGYFNFFLTLEDYLEGSFILIDVPNSPLITLDRFTIEEVPTTSASYTTFRAANGAIQAKTQVIPRQRPRAVTHQVLSNPNPFWE